MIWFLIGLYFGYGLGRSNVVWHHKQEGNLLKVLVLVLITTLAWPLVVYGVRFDVRD